MYISSAADRLAPPRRVQPRHMVGVLLLAIGLIAIVVAIAISSNTSGTGRVSARPATINATSPHPLAVPTGATVSSVPGGTFRDPVTHALLAVGIPAAPQAEPGPGHR
jgi:hypothetical protein